MNNYERSYSYDTDKINEAKQRIHDLFESGNKPVVTVPYKYSSFLSNGLEPHATWIDGFDAIVGTLGREPYLPDNEKRIIVYLRY